MSFHIGRKKYADDNTSEKDNQSNSSGQFKKWHNYQRSSEQNSYPEKLFREKP